MNPIEKVQQLIHGMKVLSEWIGEGAVPVERPTAQGRADICLRCPMNTVGITLIESAAAKIKEQIELKKKLDMVVEGEQDLNTCSACSCYIPLKLWLQIERIKPEPEDRQRFHPDCWLLKESL